MSERIMRTELPGLKKSSKGTESHGESRMQLMYSWVSMGGFRFAGGLRRV
jgi:hypothetical protein